MRSIPYLPIAATFAVLGLAIGLAPDAVADETPEMTAETKVNVPVYRPPLRGATAAGRIGGGTRGRGERAFTLAVLAPDHTGMTTSEAPTLYWFVSETVTKPMELTVLGERGSEPVLELALRPPIERGFHAVALAEHGVRLEPRVPYEWFVALVVDPEQRSSDIVAGGEIQRIPPSDDLVAQVRAADDTVRPGVYAEAGYWYDALQGLSALVGRGPGAGAAKAQRAALLEQVGLSTAAAFDRSGKP